MSADNNKAEKKQKSLKASGSGDKRKKKLGNFEEELKRLETLSEKIREPGLPLEESMAYFEEGIRLSGELEQALEKTEGKVRKILNRFEADTEAEGEKTGDFP